MSMSESGKAVRELLAALHKAVGMTPAERNAALLMTRGGAGGRTGREAGRELIAAGRDVVRERDEARQHLADAQVTIRAMVGAGRPNDRREGVDPPAGHRWLTSWPIPSDPQPYDGRLYCATCMEIEARHTTSPTMVLAAECLERNR